MSVRAENGGSQPKVIRKLSSIELYQAALHLLDHYYGTVVTCRYTLPETIAEQSSEVAQHALDVAIAQTVLQNPVLQVGMVHVDRRKPSFVELRHIEFAHHVKWHSVKGGDGDYMTTYDKVLRHQLDTKFADVETRPQWRIAVVCMAPARQIDIFFAWNHPICDGMSGRIFHECLLRNLNHPDKGINAVLQNRVLALPGCTDTLPPPMEKIAHYGNSVGFLLGNAWKENTPQFMAPKAKRTLDRWAPIVKSAPLRTEFRSLDFNQGVTSQVVKACRSHETTLTGLFQGIVTTSLAASLDGNQAAAFTGKTAVNMRHAAPAQVKGYPGLDAKAAMGNNVSVVVHDFDAKLVATVRAALGSDTQAQKQRRDVVALLLWSIAKSARRDIEKGLELGPRNNVIGLLPFVPDWRKHVRDTEKSKARDTCWVVTNLGAMDGAGDVTGVEDPWVIEKANFSLCAQVTGPAISVSPMAIKGKSLSVDITWQAETVEAAVVNRLVDDMRDWFAYIAETA